MSIKDFLPELKKIRTIVLAIRRKTPVTIGTWEKPADLLVKEENIRGRKVTALNITLTPTGCSWAKTGGCTMCGEWSGSKLGNLVDAKYHIAQFATALSENITRYQPSWLRIYQEGSFSNGAEVDTLVQKTILRLASLTKGIEKITIETMARYISIRSAKRLRDAVLSDVELEIGMGFEAQDDIIRMVCVNKGETISQFEEAIKILKAHNIKTLAYVLLKPAFLSEQEAITEAIKTIHKAFALGFDAVSLEPVSVHGWSLVEALNAYNFYSPPWLWSLIAVIKNIPSGHDIRIGGLEYYPRPGLIAHNRHRGKKDCSARLWGIIKQYNATHDKAIFDNLTCSCQQMWEKELQQSYPPLKERINYYLDNLPIDDFLRRKIKQQKVKK